MSAADARWRGEHCSSRRTGCPFVFTFFAAENNGIEANRGARKIAGIAHLFDDRADDVMASLIKNQLANGSA